MSISEGLLKKKNAWIRCLLLCFSIFSLLLIFRHELSIEEIKKTFFIDFLEYYGGAKLLVHGGNPYSAQEIHTLQLGVKATDIPIRLWNPPLVFPFLFWLAFLPYDLGLCLWVGALCLSFLLGIHWLRQAQAFQKAPALLILLFAPTWYVLYDCLFFGQISFLLLLSVSAFFAVINVITRDAESLDGGEIAGSVGTYDEYKGRASFGKELDSGMHVNLSASGFDRHGDNGIYFPEFDDGEDQDGVSRNKNEDKVEQFQFDVGTEKLRFEGYFTKRKADFPEAPFESLFADENSVKHSREILQASYQDEIADDLELQVKTSYIHFNEQGRYYFDISEEDDESPIIARSYDDLESRTLGLETQVRQKFGEGHSITAGVDIRRHVSLDLSSEEEISYEGEEDYEFYKVLDRSAKSSDIGLYSQADFHLSESFLLTGGLRYSYYDLVEKDESFDPRIALVYQPTQATALKAIYGTAFRSPSAYERLYDDGGYSTVPPEHLGPEQIETTELSVEHYFDEGFSGRVSAYYLRFSDLIYSQFIEEVDALSFANGEDDSTGQGVEAEVQKKWEGGARLRTSYAFQENEDGATGQTSLNSPRQLAKLNVAYPLLDKDIYTGLEFQYVDERASRNMNKADDYLLMNLNLFAARIPSLDDVELSFGIYNVFDKTFVEPATTWYTSEFVPQEGRTFRLMGVWKF